MAKKGTKQKEVYVEPAGEIRPEFLKALKKFDKEVKVGDPDVVEKFISYFPATIPW